MSERVAFIQAQRRLAVLWFALSVLAFGTMIALTFGGSFGGQYGKAWSWFLPYVVPTLTLILTALFAERRQSETTATVERFVYRLTLILSGVYLVLVILSLVLYPIARSGAGKISRMELLDLSTLWLMPVQALVGIALGFFFVSREQT